MRPWPWQEVGSAWRVAEDKLWIPGAPPFTKELLSVGHGAGTLGSMLGPQKQAPSTLVLSAAQGCFYDIPEAHFGRGLDFKALASGEDQSLLVAVPQAHVSP